MSQSVEHSASNLVVTTLQPASSLAGFFILSANLILPHLVKSSLMSDNGLSSGTIKFPVYLDNHATTPLDPRVLEAMLPFFTSRFGNAASK